MYRLSVRIGVESGSCSTRKTHPATTNKLREGQRTIEMVSNRTARMPNTRLKPTVIPLRMSKGVKPRRAEKSTTKSRASFRLRVANKVETALNVLNDLSLIFTPQDIGRGALQQLLQPSIRSSSGCMSEQKPQSPERR